MYFFLAEQVAGRGDVECDQIRSGEGATGDVGERHCNDLQNLTLEQIAHNTRSGEMAQPDAIFAVHRGPNPIIFFKMARKKILTLSLI